MAGRESWVLASHNAGKIRELRDILAPHSVALDGAGELGLPEPDETESTFEGNAALKAEAALRATGRPSLADDSGLAVDALGGAPGVLSARWAGEPRDFSKAMQRVEDALNGHADRAARFVCVIALARPGETTRLYRGEVTGEIVWPPRGENGFGYDPIFRPAGHVRSFAEMSAAEKKQLSHRARALALMLSDQFGAASGDVSSEGGAVTG